MDVTSRICVSPLTGAKGRYEKKLRWAAAMGFPSCAIGSTFASFPSSFHLRSQITTSAPSCATASAIALLDGVFPTSYNDPLSFEVEGHWSDLRLFDQLKYWQGFGPGL